MTLGDRWNIGLASGDAETYDEGGTEQYGSMVAGDPRCSGERDNAKGDQQSTLDANSAGRRAWAPGHPTLTGARCSADLTIASITAQPWMA